MWSRQTIAVGARGRCQQRFRRQLETNQLKMIHVVHLSVKEPHLVYAETRQQLLHYELQRVVRVETLALGNAVLVTVNRQGHLSSSRTRRLTEYHRQRDTRGWRRTNDILHAADSLTHSLRYARLLDTRTATAMNFD